MLITLLICKCLGLYILEFVAITIDSYSNCTESSNLMMQCRLFENDASSVTIGGTVAHSKGDTLSMILRGLTPLINYSLCD